MSEPAMRLAFREEGEFVNCYLADMGTMEGAKLLASMRKPILDEVWQEWKKLMQKQLTAAIAEVFGDIVDHFEEERAPEHERNGRA